MIISHRFVPRFMSAAVAVFGLLALPGDAAAQLQADLDVVFEVPIECQIQGGSLVFLSSQYDGLNDLDRSTNIRISCLRDETVTISFGGSTQRQLTNQLNTFSRLTYALFEDPDNFAPLGNGGETIQRTVTAGNTANVTVSGRIFAGQQNLIVSGDYTDTVVMTLTL